MNKSQIKKELKRFDAEIAIAKSAAGYALTLADKLTEIKRARNLEKRKQEFFIFWTIKNFEAAEGNF